MAKISTFKKAIGNVNQEQSQAPAARKFQAGQDEVKAIMDRGKKSHKEYRFGKDGKPKVVVPHTERLAQYMKDKGFAKAS